MKSIWRLFGWVFVVGVSLAVATLVFGYCRTQPRAVIQGHLRLVQLADDGTRLVTHTVGKGRSLVNPTDQALQVWDTRNGALLHQFLNDIDRVPWFEVAANSSVIAAFPGDGTVRLIDWRAGTECTVRIDTDQMITRREFSPRGRWLYLHLPIAAEDLYIDVAAARVAQRRHDSFVAFTADERLVAIRNHHDWDEPIQLVSVETGKPEAQIAGTFTSALMAPTGDLLALAIFKKSEDDVTWLTFEVWDLKSQKRRFRHTHHGNQLGRMHFSGDGKFFAAASYVFDTADGKIIANPSQSARFLDGPAGSLVALVNSKVPQILDDSGNVIWLPPTSGAAWFDFGSRATLILAKDAEEIDVIETRTGTRLGRVKFDISRRPAAKFTQDGGHVLLRGIQPQAGMLRVPPRLAAPAAPANPDPAWKQLLQRWMPWFFPAPAGQTVAVIEAESGRVLFSTQAQQNEELSLSEDGAVLLGLTTTSESIIRIWDVHPGRAWLWSIASGVIAACTLLLLGRVWRRLRRGANVRLPPPPFSTQS